MVSSPQSSPSPSWGGRLSMLILHLLYVGIVFALNSELRQSILQHPWEGSAKKNSAKKYVLREVPKATQEPAKAWKGKATAEPAMGPANKWKKPFPPRKSEEQRQVLRTENKCFICEKLTTLLRIVLADSEDKEDRKGKRPMAGLVPDMVGDRPSSDASELCRAWGKVRDQTMLIFFDPGAKANFISPELASKLGIRLEEMGYTAEAGLACPSCHQEVHSYVAFF
ncbi:hypothetical protein L7F22_042669 [Adiantum nelumboides]|nr:hypothetical protein [Adiantum nelumboides]